MRLALTLDAGFLKYRLGVAGLPLWRTMGPHPFNDFDPGPGSEEPESILRCVGVFTTSTAQQRG